MKKILLTLALAAMSASAFAQTTANGLISYYNRVLQDPTINAGASRSEPITLSDQAAALAGLAASQDTPTTAFSIGLFWKNAQGVYTLANLPGANNVPGTTPGLGAFRPDVSGANAGTMAGPITVEIPGIAAGSAVTFRIGAWLTSQGSFDQATVKGFSPDLTLAQLGGNPPSGGASIPTPNLSGLGFRGFEITPEPSTYALGIAGLGALALMRRRK